MQKRWLGAWCTLRAQVASATRHAWYPFAPRPIHQFHRIAWKQLRRLVVKLVGFENRILKFQKLRQPTRSSLLRFTANNLTRLSARYTSFLDLGEFLSSNVCNS